jgi:hypothetical protein
MDDCHRMAQNIINLTINDWSLQDCEEFLEDMEKEFRKAK